MPKVVCLRPEKDFADAGVEIPPELEMVCVSPEDPPAVRVACREAEFILSAKEGRITGEIILNSPRLKFISLTCTGYDHIDTAAARRANIPVANNGGSNARCVAQFVIMAVSVLNRRILEADRGVKEGRFQEIRAGMLDEGLFDFSGLRIGILGLGRIGREVAALVNVLGAVVLYYDLVRLPREKESELSATYLEFPDLIRQSDILTIHLPLTPGTRRLIGADQLALMKPTAILVNTGRGAIVDDVALAEAIRNNIIAGAAIDTFESVPSPEHPFLQLALPYRDHLLLTPHIAGATRQSFRRMLAFALENIMRVVRNEDPLSVVN